MSAPDMKTLSKVWCIKHLFGRSTGEFTNQPRSPQHVIITEQTEDFAALG